MKLLAQKPIHAELRLCSPTSPSSCDIPASEFFTEMSVMGSRYEIALVSPFNSPEPYQELVKSLAPATKGKHRLRLVTSLKDQGHFPEIKTILNSAAKKLDYEIRVLPDPSSNPDRLPDDSLHAKLLVLSRDKQDICTPIEAFFGSANYTWRGLGFASTGSHTYASAHYWELLARMADTESRAAALELFEMMYSNAGAWKPASMRPARSSR